MSLSYEQIHGGIARLPLMQQRRLLDELTARLTLTPVRTSLTTNGHQPHLPLPDPAPNDEWLALNADQYRGQWVALAQGQLIAHGNDSAALAQAVKASEAKIPLLVFIEPLTEAPEFTGWL